MKPRVLIAGGGLAGLSCARELFQHSHPYLLVEKEKDPGGLCRSVLTQGFTYDYTGHFLHFQDPKVKEWVLGWVGDRLKVRRRHAVIHSEGTYSEYPYQENNAGLPSATVRENVLGYLQAQLGRRSADGTGPADDFRTWCLRSFGEGISKNFMFPYNQKLWKFPLHKLSTHWMGRFVPRPRVLEVLEGARGSRNSSAGYNATFLYPDQGGISILPQAIAKGLPDLWLGAELAGLHLGKRTAWLKDGRAVPFDRMVSSLPLPRLVRLTRDLPAGLRRMAGRLKATSIYNINLGLRGRQPIPYSWVYFPGAEFTFHRAGSVSACVPTVAPSGHFSLYVEFSYRGPRPSPKVLGKQALEGLKHLGWIKSGKQVVSRADLDLPGAYVIYDRDRECVPELLDHYRRKGVDGVGRYGLWEYGSMESAIAQGTSAARRILGRR
ncbi:MAG TPA: FAD-dependent oxidoreductase [bacterium]|nr:FAD-dependent oxidoreductase [bacterium]